MIFKNFDNNLTTKRVKNAFFVVKNGERIGAS